MNKALDFFANEMNEKQIKRKIPPIFWEIPGYLNPLGHLIISYFFIKYKIIIVTKTTFFFSLILLILFNKLYEAKIRLVTA